MNKRSKSIAGFTLVELMIIVAIIGILAGIALPNYMNYVKKSKAQEAPAELSKMKNRIEQYFQDYQTYDADNTRNLTGITTDACVPSDPKNFTYACSNVTTTTYTITATGDSSKGMSGFSYSIDQDGNKSSIYDSNSMSCWQTGKGVC